MILRLLKLQSRCLKGSISHCNPDVARCRGARIMSILSGIRSESSRGVPGLETMRAFKPVIGYPQVGTRNIATIHAHRIIANSLRQFKLEVFLTSIMQDYLY